METLDYALNASDYEYYERSGVFGYITLGVKCTIMVWIIVINIIFLVAMKSFEHLKKKCSHWLLINLAAADLLVGLLIAPISIYLEVMGYWSLGKIACNIWILADVLLCCVSLFALFTINIDRLVFVMKPLTYTIVMRKPICVYLIVFTWLLATGVMLPLVFTKQVHAADGQCYISLVPPYAIGSSIVSFFLPALLVIITNICIMIIVSKKTRPRRKSSIYLEAKGPLVMATMVEARERASRDANRKLKKVACVMSIANSFYLFMWFPFFLLNILIVWELYKDISVFALEFCIWLGYANSGLNPLLWMIYPDIRKAVRNAICCCCTRSRSRSVPDDTFDHTKNTMYTNTM